MECDPAIDEALRAARRAHTLLETLPVRDVADVAILLRTVRPLLAP